MLYWLAVNLVVTIAILKQVNKLLTKYKKHLTFGAAGLALGFGVLSTMITGQCTFIKNEKLKTMTLAGDCTTDESILIPDGYTLYGENHTIKVRAGDYNGAVVENAGDVASVHYLNIELDEFYKGCQKLVGIAMEDASGTILHNNIFNEGILCNKEAVKVIGNHDNYVEIAFNNFGGTEDTWIKIFGDIKTLIHSNGDQYY